MPTTRRTLLRAAAAIPLGVLWARAAKAVTAPERFLWVRNGAGEELATAYRAGEEYDPRALSKLRHLLRDMHVGTEGPLPPLLADMLSVLQEQWGYTRPLIVRSGYRTPRTNASLEGAAPASLHLVGQAADIVVPGMAPNDVAMAVWTLSRRLGFLGIGVYPRFVHMDIGPQRVWTRWR
ncbi:DUF882 domain-containing protein [Roseomonas sp. AR75]|uniref:YcbK family protein n=1 Tax=Roseomonas sp. AR75 TaxID=2562311 RepID=UPI001484FB66|nr:DUF882 domain-containing protein [Roseomonas sp. AR75]